MRLTHISFINHDTMRVAGLRARGVDISTGPPSDLKAAFTNNAKWIWTKEEDMSSVTQGQRIFRTLVVAAAEILITADDYFTLYLNGDWAISTVYDPRLYKQATWYHANFHTTSPSILLRISAFNVGTPLANNTAGILAAIKATYTDQSSQIFTSDFSWFASKTVSDGWESSPEEPSWSRVYTQGSCADSVWGPDLFYSNPSIELNPPNGGIFSSFSSLQTKLSSTNSVPSATITSSAGSSSTSHLFASSTAPSSQHCSNQRLKTSAIAGLYLRRRALRDKAVRKESAARSFVSTEVMSGNTEQGVTSFTSHQLRATVKPRIPEFVVLSTSSDDEDIIFPGSAHNPTSPARRAEPAPSNCGPPQYE
ncbi:hypothetical protein BDQ12DRAFT_670072 [Crucibulum laeve]|uniref:Uncharacterized protein n=1 Tax=Crucibulum laeve TaxID=68775 RepID=A0A5C3LXZ9_9AGAR|nr:hypothetical protein BDQ12DRAFT_670072 [Crucibulum laeve]